MSAPTPCIACGRQCRSVDPKDERYQYIPYAGTLFRTGGHYGSTVFDTMQADRIEVVICDDCLLLHADRVTHVEPDYTPRPPAIRRPWNPDADR